MDGFESAPVNRVVFTSRMASLSLCTVGPGGKTQRRSFEDALALDTHRSTSFRNMATPLFVRSLFDLAAGSFPSSISAQKGGQLQEPSRRRMIGKSLIGQVRMI